MISKERLVFDTANASEGDVVASFLKSADGTLLTHTDVGGKKALDVRVAEGINVEVDLNAADDSVASWTNDGAGNPISSTTGALHVLLQNASIAVTQSTSPWVVGDGGGSLTVDANNLDIRDLAFATDKVDVSGSTVALDSTTLAALESITVQNGAGASAVNIQDGGNSITVDGTVAVTQTTSPWVVSDAALAATSLTSTQKDVSSTTGALLASQAASRKYLIAQNLGNRSIYIGASGVSTASGLRLSPGSSVELRLGAALSLHAVTDSGTQDTRILEVA